AELLPGRVGVQRVLNADVGDREVLPVVADGVDVVPGRELERRVIDHHRMRAEQAERVVGGAGCFAARPDADVATDDVGLAGERDLAAAEADAAAGRGLAGDGDVALDRDRGGKLDVAADVEHDDAVRGAHGIAKRAGAGVVEVGHVDDDAVAAADRLLAEALRARKRHGRRGAAGTASAGRGHPARPVAAARARGGAAGAAGSARLAAGRRVPTRARNGAAAGTGRGHPARAPGDPAGAGAFAPAAPAAAALVGATPSRTP